MEVFILNDSKEFSMVIPDSVVELLDEMIRKRKVILPESDTSREVMAIMCIQQYHEMMYMPHLVTFDD